MRILFRANENIILCKSEYYFVQMRILVCAVSNIRILFCTNENIILCKRQYYFVQTRILFCAKDNIIL